MPNLFEQTTTPPRKVLTIFYLVDSSGSMDGTKIGAVNAAMEEAFVHELQEVSSANDDAEINVAILEFNNGSRWITPSDRPISLAEGPQWRKLKASGMTDMGDAFVELSKKLSRNAFLKTVTGARPPVIILISDGYPNDNWQKGLSELQQNHWYQAAIKLAIAIGDDVDTAVLAEFTKNPEAVIRTDESKNTLILAIKKLSEISSTFATHSIDSNKSDRSPEENAADIAKQTMEALEEENPGMIPDDGDDFFE